MGQLTHLQKGVKSNHFLDMLLCLYNSHMVQWNDVPRCSGGLLQF